MPERWEEGYYRKLLTPFVAVIAIAAAVVGIIALITPLFQGSGQ